jgi:NAD(P)-dependent dehydrogenase (short-subunit alcohol dehydrogenase family)
MEASGMQGKTVVVTGATQGIGYEAARAIARLGARVILTARDRARGERAASTISAESGATVELVLCDFASLASIRAAAAEVRERASALHVLLNNAGALYLERRESVDGLELTFATNHLGYFLFTRLLEELLVRSAPARIVNVASAAHRVARRGPSFDDLERRRGYSGFRVYGETKLMNILFTRELARRLAGTGVTANSLHPGVIASGFGTNNRGVLGWLMRHATRYVFSTPEEGAATSVFLCTSPEVEGVTGKYFARCREVRPRPQAEDDEAARRLWELSERLTGLA